MTEMTHKTLMVTIVYIYALHFRKRQQILPFYKASMTEFIVELENKTKRSACYDEKRRDMGNT